MSDFEELLNCRSEDELHEKGIVWMRQMVRKWYTEGLSEREGWELLCFMGGQVDAPAHVNRQDQLKSAFNKNGKPHGLMLAAMFYGKTPKTIRRWCKKGYFPDAFQTKGGQWRIPFRAVDGATDRLPVGFVRKPKTLFGTKLWKEFKADAQRMFGPLLGLAFETESAFQDMAEGEFAVALKTKAASLEPSEPAWDVLERTVALDKAHGGKRTQSIDFARLVALARRLRLNEPAAKLNHESLASVLKISVATLYRRFTSKQIRSALKTAGRSLRPEEHNKDDNDTSENDHATIVALTTESKPEGDRSW